MIMKQFYILLFTCLSIYTFAQPANNDPCGAISLTVDTDCNLTAGTTVGATNTTSVPVPSCSSYSKDVWYSFVAPASGSVQIMTTENSITDGGMSLYSGPDCSTLTEIDCDDDSGPGYMPMISSIGLVAGDTYYVRFWKYSSGTGTFNICIVDVAATVANHDCSTATQVCSTSSFTDNSDGSGALGDLNASNNGCLTTNEHQSAWYYFQIATSGTLTYTISPTSSTDDFDFGIWGPTTTCPITYTPSRCSYAAGGGNTGLNMGAADVTEDASGNRWVKYMDVSAGDFYIVCVDNFSSSNSGFGFSFGGTATINCDPVVLPVELNSFTATAEQAVNVVQWSTASEHNSDYFAVEKSADGVHFTEAGRVNAAGASTAELRYTFTDNAPINGDTYYRLNQVDANASSLRSNIISVYNAMAASVNIYPNPSTGSINVTVNTPEKGNSTIEIFTAYGQPVYKTHIDGVGQQTKTVTLPSKGIFWVVVQSGNERYIEKISY